MGTGPRIARRGESGFCRRINSKHDRLVCMGDVPFSWVPRGTGRQSLRLVADSPGITAREIAKALALTKPYAQRLLRAHQAYGHLVSGRRDREKGFTLSHQGAECLRAAEARQ